MPWWSNHFSTPPRRSSSSSPSSSPLSEENNYPHGGNRDNNIPMSPEDMIDQWFDSILRQNHQDGFFPPYRHRHHHPNTNIDDDDSSPTSISNFSSYSSSYQMEETNERVQISVNVPGLSKDDIDVQVVSQTGPYSSCMVQLFDTSNNNNNNNNKNHNPDTNTTTSSSETTTTTTSRRRQEHQHQTLLGQRFRLGKNVDCDHLAATLSRGVLHLTAPKFQPEPVSEPVKRSIPIREEDS